MPQSVSYVVAGLSGCPWEDGGWARIKQVIRELGLESVQAKVTVTQMVLATRKDVRGRAKTIGALKLPTLSADLDFSSIRAIRGENHTDLDHDPNFYVEIVNTRRTAFPVKAAAAWVMLVTFPETWNAAESFLDPLRGTDETLVAGLIMQKVGPWYNATRYISATSALQNDFRTGFLKEWADWRTEADRSGWQVVYEREGLKAC